MSDSTPHRLSIAVALCESTIPLLKEISQSTVADELEAIVASLRTEDFTSAIDLCSKLPRHDIANFWESMEWMEENPIPIERKALLLAYYSQSLKALGDWRVNFQ